MPASRPREGLAFFGGAPLPRLPNLRVKRGLCTMVGAVAARPLPGVHTLYVKAGAGGAVRGDCPFSAKAMLALAVKGVAFDERWIDFADKPAWYLELNPDGTVPTLVGSDAEVIGSSDEIVAFADEVGGVSLRLYREASDLWAPSAAVIGPVFGAFAKLMKSKDESQHVELKAALATALKAVDEHLEKSGGPFMLGEDISAMDLNIGPKLQHIAVAGAKFRNVGIAEYPNLVTLREALLATDAWKETACADEELITGWTRHAV